MTGGTRGIGLATSLFFARAGCRVAMVYRSRRPDAEKALAAVKKFDGEAITIAADLAHEGEARRAVETTRRKLGHLDFLINNAGTWPEGAVEKIPARQWQRAFDTNMTSMFLATRFSVPAMKKRRFGRIVNLSSTAGQRGEPFHSHYAATKGAAISFTKSLAVELGPFGITVNAVAPGWVDTEMSAPALKGNRLARAKIEAAIPTGRVSTAGDIGAMIVFLCSDFASNINGEIVNINGGSVLAG